MSYLLLNAGMIRSIEPDLTTEIGNLIANGIAFSLSSLKTLINDLKLPYSNVFTRVSSRRMSNLVAQMQLNSLTNMLTSSCYYVHSQNFFSLNSHSTFISYLKKYGRSEELI